MSFDKPKEFEALIRRIGKVRAVLEGPEMDEVLEHLAHKARDFMADGIRTGRPEWPALSEFTKQQKGSDRKLMDTGEMVGEINAWKDGDQWYAGIPASSPASMRAAVQEEGAHIPVTDGMRRFFASQKSPLRADTRFIRIPPRPWLKPAEAELAEYAVENVDELLDSVMQKILEG
jgi:hypothetical protein